MSSHCGGKHKQSSTYTYKPLTLEEVVAECLINNLYDYYSKSLQELPDKELVEERNRGKQVHETIDFWDAIRVLKNSSGPLTREEFRAIAEKNRKRNGMGVFIVGLGCLFFDIFAFVCEKVHSNSMLWLIILGLFMLWSVKFAFGGAKEWWAARKPNNMDEKLIIRGHNIYLNVFEIAERIKSLGL